MTRACFTAMFAALIFLGAPCVAAEQRVALVVGNSAYVNTSRLANPINDARDMAAALRAVGFDVVEAFDADKRRLDAAVRAFADKLAGADVALFFYAGHGLQLGLKNYLVPIDAKLEKERDLEFEAVGLDVVLRQMEIDREGKTSIVLLDACRDNPLSRSLARSMGTRSAAIGRGLASAPAGLGTFIAFATQPENVAQDGQGRNSPFTGALLRHLRVAGRGLPALMIEVRKDVVQETRGAQVPWDHSALVTEFQFVAGARPPAPPAAAAPAAPPSPPREAAPPPVSSPSALPVQPRDGTQKPPTLPLVENVRLDGRIISTSRQPSPQACRLVCEANPICIGFQHGKRIPVMGQCQIFDSVTARVEDPQWRSGTR